VYATRFVLAKPVSEAREQALEHEEALKCLTRVVRRQLYQAPYIKAGPRLDALRMQHEFEALLREAGLN
jgi:hypothetical protein